MEKNNAEVKKSVEKDVKEELSDAAVANEDEGETGSGYRSDKEGSESSDVSDRVTTSKDSDGYEVDSESNRESNSKDSLNGDAENKTVVASFVEDPHSEDNSDHFEEAVEIVEDVNLVRKSENDSEGYEEGNESGSEESDVPSDSNRHHDSTGYNEESDNDDENDTEKVKVQRKRQGAKDDDESEEEKCDSDSSEDVLIESGDENKTGEDWGSEAEGSAEGDEDEEQKVTKQAIVPRRTRFWDHDDRFDDITIEESREAFDQSREEARNKKLWDRTAEKWVHDLYVEEEQAPKEEWEKQQQSERRNEQQQRRRERTVGDYIQNARGRGGRYNPRRNYNQREIKEDSISMRVKEEQNGREERTNQDSRSSEEPESRVAPTNRRYFNKEGSKIEKNDTDEQFPALKSEAQTTNEASSSSTTAKKTSTRSETEAPKPKIEKGKKKETNENTRDVKEKTAIVKNFETSAKKEQRPAKGRGRGMINENLKKGQKTASDFNKEKKVTDNERSLVQKLKEQRESKEDYDDVEESAETKTGPKPKRYSSQRLKQTNTGDPTGDESEMPSAQFSPQFPGMLEEMQYYPQAGGVPLQMPNMQGLGADSASTSQLMMQRLMQQQQMIQMQMQQLRMHHQQQQPQMIHQQVPAMESTQSPVPDILPQQTPGVSYAMPTQGPQPTMPYQPVLPTGTGTMPMQQPMNPEEYQMMMNQMMAPRMFMAPPPGGLFIPNQMQQQQQQQTRQRNSAIPIKPPPELQPTES